jgi:hypothetical protein
MEDLKGPLATKLAQELAELLDPKLTEAELDQLLNTVATSISAALKSGKTSDPLLGRAPSTEPFIKAVVTTGNRDEKHVTMWGQRITQEIRGGWEGRQAAPKKAVADEWLSLFGMVRPEHAAFNPENFPLGPISDADREPLAFFPYEPASTNGYRDLERIKTLGVRHATPRAIAVFLKNGAAELSHQVSTDGFRIWIHGAQAVAGVLAGGWGWTDNTGHRMFPYFRLRAETQQITVNLLGAGSEMSNLDGWFVVESSIPVAAPGSDRAA